MSRVIPVLKREFVEMSGTRGFMIGTVLGPILLIAFFYVQFLIAAKSGGGTHRIAIVDASDADVGRVVAEQLENPPPVPSFSTPPTFAVTVEPAQARTRAEATSHLQERVTGEALDGYLWIPPDILDAGTAEYEGTNASNSRAISQVERALVQAVQRQRLRAEGIDEQKLALALVPVRMQAYRTGERGVQGNPTAVRMLAFLMAFAIYLAVLLYGQTIMTGVQEEKRDRVVEVMVSSIRARDLLLGKVLGIGLAGVLQMVIWALTAGLLIAKGDVVLRLIGADPEMIRSFTAAPVIPDVPLAAAIIFVLCFAGGFFLFATLYAVIGSAVTSTQEAQTMAMPVVLPFIFALFIAMSAGENPNSTMAIAASYFPLSSPVVLPVRALSGGVGLAEAALSLAILFGTGLLIIWIAAKIYRIAIFATGKRPTWGELVRWARAA